MPTPEAHVRVQVAPGAARSEVVGPYGDGWKVRVSAPPDRGRANDAVLRLLAETVGLPRRDVSLVSGHSGPAKVVRLGGVDDAEAARRLRAGSRS